jgi:hypothetical protein
MGRTRHSRRPALGVRRRLCFSAQSRSPIRSRCTAQRGGSEESCAGQYRAHQPSLFPAGRRWTARIGRARLVKTLCTASATSLLCAFVLLAGCGAGRDKLAIRQVLPSAPQPGGVLLIHGQGFTRRDGVLINGQAAASVTWVNAAWLTAVLPGDAPSGTSSVTVTGPFADRAVLRDAVRISTSTSTTAAAAAPTAAPTTSLATVSPTGPAPSASVSPTPPALQQPIGGASAAAPTESQAQGPVAGATQTRAGQQPPAPPMREPAKDHGKPGKGKK